MKKLTKRAIASRANGKLSHGPVSPAGKLRSSANSTRHGILAMNLVLADESKDLFALLHQQYIDRINPTDGIEISLVEELAALTWRQRRILAMETNLFNQAAANRTETDSLARIAGAFSDLSRSPEIQLLDRYESRLHRMFQRTLKNIQLLRQIEPGEPSTGELTQLPESVKFPYLPNEPKSEQPPVESEPYPATSIQANPTPLPAESPASIEPAPADLPLPASAEIHELPNEPKSVQSEEKPDAYPQTFQSQPQSPTKQPADPYAGYPRFEIHPITGSLKRIA